MLFSVKHWTTQWKHRSKGKKNILMVTLALWQMTAPLGDWVCKVMHPSIKFVGYLVCCSSVTIMLQWWVLKKNNKHAAFALMHIYAHLYRSLLSCQLLRIFAWHLGLNCNQCFFATCFQKWEVVSFAHLSNMRKPQRKLVGWENVTSLLFPHHLLWIIWI